MNGALAFSVFALASASPNLTGTLEEWDAFQEAEPRTAEAFLFGVAQGFGWANATLEQRGDKPLYCIPKRLTLLSTNYLHMAAEEIARRRAAGNLPAGYTMELALLGGLTRSFPCPKGGA